MPVTTSHTYESLVEQIQLNAEDESDELVANIPEIVRRAETRVYTDLDLEIFSRIRTGQLTAGVFTQDIKPATWQGTRTFWIRADDSGDPTGRRIYLFQRSYEYCMEYEPDETAVDEPRQYAELSETEYFVSPAPDAVYHYEIREISQEAALGLSPTNDTTWLGSNAGDLLIAACDVEAGRFLGDADLKTLEEAYQALIGTRREQLRALVRVNA